MLPSAERRPLKRRGLVGAWRESLHLADGRELLLRPIESADAAPMRAGFELLSADEIRMRFLHPMRELPPNMATRLANPTPKREFALVVAEPLPPGEALVGAVVRASIDDQGRHAEFAILVWRFLSRLGLGRLLMKRVIFWAKLKKLETLYGDVLDENVAMLRLAESLGFRRVHHDGDPGITRIVLRLRPAPPSEASANN